MNWLIREDFAAADRIEAGLLADLRSLLPQSLNTPLTFACFDGAGALLGGASGGTSYGWLLVKLLWVAEPYRRQGMATALLEKMETRGVELGCHGAWLDSSNPDAVNWYSRRGYAPFGELANGPGQRPAGHRRVFMCKSLG